MKAGDWFLMQYGFDELVFYVLWVGEKRILANHSGWLVSSTHFFNSDKMPGSVTMIGHTSRRWWWRYLPWRDLVCPFKPINFLPSRVAK